MKTRYRHLTASLFGLALFALALSACDSTGPENDNDDDPPAVVPPAAFEFNVELFNEQSSSNAKAGKTNDQSHFTNAAFRVWPTALIFKASLLIPAAVTHAALEADPVPEDGTWVWESVVDTSSQQMSFRLEGTPDGESVFWSMHVTAQNPTQDFSLDDFELYTAETAIDGSSGSWSLFLPQNGESQNVLDGEFTVENDSTKEATFSIPENSQAFGDYAGSSVQYNVDGPQRTFVWTRVTTESEKVMTVTWNTETKVGSIVAPDYNGGEMACWDESKVNVECSS